MRKSHCDVKYTEFPYRFVKASYGDHIIYWQFEDGDGELFWLEDVNGVYFDKCRELEWTEVCYLKLCGKLL